MSRILSLCSLLLVGACVAEQDPSGPDIPEDNGGTMDAPRHTGMTDSGGRVPPESGLTTCPSPPPSHQGVPLCSSIRDRYGRQAEECLTLQDYQGGAGLVHVTSALYFCVVAEGADSYCWLGDH